MKTLLDKNNNILRQLSEPVFENEFSSAWLRELIDDLFIIMANKGAVGVAAPQIGINKRVIVFGTAYTKHRKPEYPIPNTTLINPSLNLLSDKMQIDYEGCLNCGELMGKVSRSMDIEYSGFDIDGNFITKHASGLEARILQHEIDHLNGLLFLDYIKNKEDLTTITELQKKI